MRGLLRRLFGGLRRSRRVEGWYGMHLDLADYTPCCVSVGTSGHAEAATSRVTKACMLLCLDAVVKTGRGFDGYLNELHTKEETSSPNAGVYALQLDAVEYAEPSSPIAPDRVSTV